MFLKSTIRRNPNLIMTAVNMHQLAKISPNTYVIDLDAVRHNAKAIKEAADRFGVSLYFVTKQFGRNPAVAKAIVDSGIRKALAIDAQEAKILSSFGISIGHVGHLVQVPIYEIEKILKMRPEVITVFDIEKAKQISKIAERLGITQKILIRPVAEGDFFYPGQIGGIPEKGLLKNVRAINRVKRIKVVGVTSFPCVLYSEMSRKLEPTQNFDTILRAASLLERKLGIEIEQINAPGSTSVAGIELIAKKGATHGEPGHGLTGTTPLHAFADQPEIPAIVYVSEVSHTLGNKAYTFGGGFYSRCRLESVLIGRNPDTILERKFSVKPIEPEYIDYYGVVHLDPKMKVNVGDTAVYAFRTQIFVTRARVAVVNGIQMGKPSLLGTFDRGYIMLDENENPLSIENARKLINLN